MKTFLYICIALGALLLPASKGLRDAVVVMIKSVATGIERVVIRGDYAEIRMIDGDEFDMVINEPGRLVIVAVQSEISNGSRGQAEGLNQAIKGLPSEVLVAKVIAERNQALLKRLKIPAIPTLQIYSRGKLVKEFKGDINKDEFMQFVTNTLKNPEGNSKEPTILPLDDNWMPSGVERESSKRETRFTPLNP